MGGDGDDQDPTPLFILAPIVAEPVAPLAGARIPEHDTEDVPLPSPAVVRELMIGLERGRLYFDPMGNRLTTVDEIVTAIRHHHKVLARPPGTTQRLKGPR